MRAFLELTRSPIVRNRHIFVLATVCGFVTICPTYAIDIQIELKNTGQNPSYDPDGTLLLGIMEAAAVLWEDAMPDGGLHKIDLFWSTSEFDPGSSTLAHWDPTSADNNIVFNAQRLGDGSPGSWYFDPTPSDHSEFDFSTQIPNPPGPKIDNYDGGHWLYEDLSPTAKTAWFTGSPPDMLEVGYLGRASDPTILVQQDVFSVALHELGHELGVNSNAAFPETLNPNPAWVGGASMTFERTSDGGGFDGEGHLAAAPTLMFPTNGRGSRTLPSSVDIMAAADALEHTNIDLPRQGYLGDGPWHNSANWLGGTVPDSDDLAYLRDSSDVFLTATAIAREVQVSRGSNLSTGTQTLLANKVSSVGLGTDIFIQPGGKVEADEVTISNIAEIEITGGTLDAGTVNILVNSQIESPSGGGTVLVRETLTNDGRIVGGGGGILSLSSLGGSAAPWDLDGADESGAIEATGGNINLQVQGVTEPFSGTIEIGESRRLLMEIANSHRWEIDGDVNFHGGTTLATAAKLSGVTERLDFDNADITVDGNAVVAAESWWKDGTYTILADAASVLRIGEDTLDTISLNSVTFTGPGKLVLNANTTVGYGDHPSVNVDQFDWDGPAGTSETYVSGLAKLVITGNITDAHDAPITIDGGEIVVTDDDWTLSGGLTIGDSGFEYEDIGRLSGNGIVTLASAITVEGVARINAPALLTAATDATVDFEDELRFQQATTYRGGTYQGAGAIHQDGAATVEQNTTLGTNFHITGGEQFWLTTFDWDGSSEETASTTVESGKTLTVNAVRIESDHGGSSNNNGYDGIIILDGGNLVVNTGTRSRVSTLPGILGSANVNAAPWQLNGSLQLLQNGSSKPLVQGSPLVVTGSIEARSGESTVAPTLTTLATSSVSSGQIFVLNGATLNMGTLQLDGGLVVVDEFSTLNLSNTNFAGTNLSVVRFGSVNLAGTTTLGGGYLSGEGSLRQQGNATVTTDMFIDSGMSFTAGSLTTINAGATLFKGGGGLPNSGPALVLAGAQFAGSGTFHVDSDTALILQPDANMQVDIVSGGITTIGLGLFDVGNAQFKNYTQMPAGLLAIDLLSATAGMYDSILADISITLGGSLEVSLLDDFMPSLGDTFEIVSASNVSGQFETTLLPTLSGLVWDVQYNPDSVIIEVLNALAADTEPDGDVDGADFLALQRGKPALISTWQMQYGSGVSSLASSQQVPEPTRLMLLLTAAAWRSSSRFSRRDKRGR